MLVSLLLAALSMPPPAGRGPSVVQLANDANGFHLLRSGKPYFIKGVGGDGPHSLLMSCGGNSIRTWGADRIGAILDSAAKEGISVTVGIWLQHSDVFDYHDAEKVAQQKSMCEEVVRRYKDHPAVLLWAFGNEMEAYGDASDPSVWKAIDDIAASAKRIDSGHPTMTVIAELGGQRVANFNRYCPHVDILGINSYGGAPSLASRYRKNGGVKPYILTEFGPPGPWESGKTSWKAPLELTSTEKAVRYAQSYKAAVLDQPGLCLGSYAFLWSHKSEGTATWFGMFLPDGSRTAAIDTMAKLWGGAVPGPLCPRIENLSVSQTAGLTPGQQVVAILSATGSAGEPIQVRWVLSGEIPEGQGGQTQAPAHTYPAAISNASKDRATVTAPDAPGSYRLFAYVKDARGGAAVANVPLQVVAR